ncbi:hypothetical protein NKI79_26765 [Mesorhizobium sp. M0340]|uniref:hypothetical protein n=1 Tax=Mesorhizobium sp. M0340 TaxID=2956939 RepID=UPI00333ACC16
MTQTAAAKLTAVPWRTLNRWEDERRFSATKKDTAEGKMAVENSIRVLSEHQSFSEGEVINALFAMAAWRRWPDLVHSHSAYVMLLHSSYLSKKYGFKKFSQLNEKQKLSFGDSIDLNDICRLILGTLHAPLYFDLDGIDPKVKYSKRDLSADVGSFFINAKANGVAPSINNSFRILEAGAFTKPFTMGEKAFRGFWRDNASVMPFDYVEAHGHRGLEFDLDPEDPGFVDQFDALLNKLPEVAQYIAACKWAVGEFKSALDLRALRTIWFPDFPSSVQARQLRPAKFESEMIRVIA